MTILKYIGLLISALIIVALGMAVLVPTVTDEEPSSISK